MPSLQELAQYGLAGLKGAAPDLILIVILLVVAVVGNKIIDAITTKWRRKAGDTFKVRLTAILVQTLFLAVIIIIMLSRVGVTEDFLQLLGLVLAGIIAFSSTALITNLVSGIIINSTKPFRKEEIIKIGDQIGKVKAIGPVHTRLLTFEKVVVYIPNVSFVTKDIVNYSREGFRMKIKVSLGYDIDRVHAETAMIKAAKRTKLEDVFVAITNLDNHYVTYELNGTSHKPDAMPFLESRLRKMILDEFNIAKMEIASPALLGHRQTKKNIVTKTTPHDRGRFRRKEQEEEIQINKLVKDTFESEAPKKRKKNGKKKKAKKKAKKRKK